MDKNQILAVALIAGGLYYFTSKKNTSLAPQYAGLPAAPPKNSPNYQLWVKYVVDLYGKVADLWKPGGPFYKEQIPQYDAGSQFWQDVDNIAGVGKAFDEGAPQIRPNSRVDRFWETPRGRNRIEKYLQATGVPVVQSRVKFADQDVVKRTFDLHSIEFGNWLNQAERIAFLYATAATMADIATVLKLPFNRIGMHGYLAIAFGSRGNGGRAAAFYIPLPYHLINLTRPHGKGTFIHEFGHAVDFYLGKPSGAYSHRTEIIPEKPGTVKYLFEKAIGAVLWNKDGSPSSYQRWIAAQSNRDYYGRRTEIWARMCEAYFHQRFKTAGIKNEWGVDRHLRADIPAADLVKRAAPYMTSIFKLLNK